MTEEEWLACEDPEPMLRVLMSKGSDRKRRLFCCAAASHVGAASPDDQRRRCGIDAVERCAESGEPLDQCPELYATRAPTIGILYRWPQYGMPPSVLVGQLVGISTTICLIEAMSLFTEIPSEHPGIVVEFGLESGSVVDYNAVLTRTLRVEESESKRYRDGSVAILLRDVFGNPFRPVPISPTWLTPNVLALARTAYDHRAFDTLPILADALEDAGCDAADLLAHLRSAGPHVRGCWALDLVLGKE